KLAHSPRQLALRGETTYASRGGSGGLPPAGGLGAWPPEDTSRPQSARRSEATERRSRPSGRDAAARWTLGVGPPLPRLRRTEGGGARRGLGSQWRAGTVRGALRDESNGSECDRAITGRKMWPFFQS